MNEREKYLRYVLENCPEFDEMNHQDFLDTILDAAGIYTEGNEFDPLPFTLERGEKVVETFYRMVPKVVVETGTYAGIGTEWFRATSYRINGEWIEPDGEMLEIYDLSEVLEEVHAELINLVTDEEHKEFNFIYNHCIHMVGGKPRILFAFHQQDPGIPPRWEERALAFFERFGPLGIKFSNISSFLRITERRGSNYYDTTKVVPNYFSSEEYTQIPCSVAEFFGPFLRDPSILVTERKTNKPSNFAIAYYFDRIRQGFELFDRVTLYWLYREPVVEVFKEVLKFKEAVRFMAGDSKDLGAKASLELALMHSIPFLDEKEGALKARYRTRSLLDACYVSLLEEKALCQDLKRCPGCGIWFHPRGKEKYCSKKCKNRKNINDYRRRNRVMKKV